MAPFHPTGTGPDCLACRMQEAGLCHAVGPAGRAELARHATLHDYRANATVWDEDHGRDCVGVLVSGFLRLQSYSLDGRRQILAIYTPGDVIGGDVLANGALPAEGCSIDAATTAQICRFDPGSFERLVQSNPGLRRALYRLRLLKLDHLRLLTWALAALDAEERFCAFLALATRIMPFARRAGGGLLALDLPRVDIADLLGTTVETISRISNRLDAEGVIRIRDARHFEIPDLDRLVARGCLTDTFAHVHFAAPPREAPPNFIAGQLSERRLVGGLPLQPSWLPPSEASEARQ